MAWDNPLLWFGPLALIGGYLWWRDRRRRIATAQWRAAHRTIARSPAEAERVGTCVACQRMQELWRENPQLGLEHARAIVESQIDAGTCPAHRCGADVGRRSLG